MASFWTLAGVRPMDGDEVSPWSLAERVSAAAEAGFEGIGFSCRDLASLKRDIGADGIRRVLEEYNIQHCEYESLFDWWTEGERRVAADRTKRELLQTVEEIAAPHSHVKCCPELEGGSWAPEAYAEGLAALASEAERAGARVGLELLPYSDLSTPADGLAVIEAGGNATATTGLILDIWHMERRGVPHEAIQAVPAERIVHVELDDGNQPVGAFGDDTIDNRRLGGEGSFDIAGFVAAVRSTGFDGAYGVEIISKKQRALPLRTAAQRAFETTVKYL